MATKNKERQFLLECIDLYKDLPALWQVHSTLYRDRDKKNKAYDFLLAKYRKMFPEATKEDLKKKFNSLRTNYRKELKKHRDSMKPEANTDSIYTPTSWYFHKMNFLRDQESHLESENSMDTHKIGTADWDVDYAEQISETRSSADENQDSHSTVSRTNAYECAPKRARISEQLVDSSYERLSDVRDEFYHWGMVCAADLRSMERSQQIYAKKAIADIMMQGQLGLLDRNSVHITNENPLIVSSVKIEDLTSP